MRKLFNDRERRPRREDGAFQRQAEHRADGRGSPSHYLQPRGLSDRPARSRASSFDWPRISVRALKTTSGGRAAPDKGSTDLEVQDQSASLTSLTTHANGVEIYVEATGVYTSTEFPDGFKWTQTIDTNVPKGGTTSPYVDPRPNDDTKPFYYTDAEHAASPTTFYDRPSRPAPATGVTTWQAILGLNGVNEASKTVQGFDFLTYGFTIDAAGTVTLSPGASTTGANHQSTLSSEFADWTFT